MEDDPPVICRELVLHKCLGLGWVDEGAVTGVRGGLALGSHSVGNDYVFESVFLTDVIVLSSSS